MQKNELNYEELGNRIKKYRKGMGLSQEHLAELVGVDPSNISHIERARTKVSLPTLVKIANALQVSLDQLTCDSVGASSYLIQNDIAELLADCTPQEVKIIRDIISVTKDSIRKNEANS